MELRNGWLTVDRTRPNRSGYLSRARRPWGEVRAGLARNREADTERPALIRDLLDI